MDITSIATLLIPGFDILSPEQRNTFLSESPVSDFFRDILQQVNANSTRSTSTNVAKVMLANNLIEAAKANAQIPMYEHHNSYRQVQFEIDHSLYIRANALAKCLSWNTDSHTFATDLFNRYHDASDNVNHNIVQIEQHFLCAYLLRFTEQTLSDKTSRVDEDDMQKVANTMLKRIYDHSSTILENLFPLYADALRARLKRKWLSPTGKPRVFQNQSPTLNLGQYAGQLVDELACVVSGAGSHTNAAETKGILQFFGFIQHQGGILSASDALNVREAAPFVRKVKEILSYLFKPFSPLYQEYHHLNRHSEHYLWTLTRIVMPVIVMLASVFALSTVMTFFVASWLADIIAILPIILISLAAANVYVIAKNALFHTISTEFSVNSRMETAFNLDRDAENVRLFYEVAIKTCNGTETYFSEQNPLDLTEEEQAEREDNVERKKQLQEEWYQIHDDANLGSNRTQSVMSKRFYIEGDLAYQKLEQQIESYPKHLHKELKIELSPSGAPFSSEPFAERLKFFNQSFRNQNARIEQFDTLGETIACYHSSL